MAGTIEDNDDLILLIVGDKKIPEEDPLLIQTSSPVSIKEEPLEFEHISAVDDILETAIKHGEYIEIKEEPEFSDQNFTTDVNEFVPVGLEDDIKSESEEEGYFPEHNAGSDNLHSNDTNPKEYSFVTQLCNVTVELEEDIKSESDEQEYISEHNAGSDNLQSNDTKPKKFSFVAHLRNTNSEMRDDPEWLVENLTNIMKGLKPPTPPANFCTKIEQGSCVKFECSFCKAKYDSATAASRHYQVKHGKRYLTCFACGDDFRSTTNLYKHEKRCSAEDAPIVLRARGHFLGRRGRARPFLTNHKFKSPLPRPPPPPRPPRPPKRKSWKPYSEKPRFYCTKCPATFVQIQNLIGHENSHYGLRPYRCDSCPAAYTSEIALKRHLQKHGDNKFICDHCGREFKLKPLLVSHLNTHRPLRKLACPQCPRRFAQKPALQHHLNRDHLHLPPACGCPVCPKRYARMSHVKDHMKKAHGLAMITRKMFFKALPTMSDAKEIKNAKIVLKSEINQFTSPLMPFTLENIKAKQLKKAKTKKKT